jgi:hypothetical protein
MIDGRTYIVLQVLWRDPNVDIVRDPEWLALLCRHSFALARLIACTLPRREFVGFVGRRFLGLDGLRLKI